MVINEGTVVSFSSNIPRALRFYAAIANGEELSEQGELILKSTKFCFYHVDPLTSEVQPSFAGYDRSWIQNLQIVRALPVVEDFEIDRLDFFFDWRLTRHKAWIDDREDHVTALRFWTCFVTFLDAYGKELLRQKSHKPDSLRKSDFTALGLDFMRQHYRSLKFDAIRKGGDVSVLRLQELLHDTREHRTKDQDWIPQNFKDGVFLL